MDELLGNGVAGEDAVEPPGADLALRIVGIVAAAPDLGTVVNGLAGDHVADVAGMHAANRLPVELAGSGLEINEHDAAFFRSFAARVGDRLATGHVHGDRLGTVDMAAGIDPGQGLPRMEVGRAFDDDGVRPGVEQPLVARQAAEGMVLGHAQLSSCVPGAIGKIIGRGHELVSAVLLEEIGDPLSSPAAADQAEGDLGVRGRGHGLPGFDDQQSRGGGRSAGQETAAAEVLVTGRTVGDGSHGRYP